MSEQTVNFIDQLKEYNRTNFSKDIFVPSLERDVKFSTLTAKHQRDIIHSTLDNPLLNLVFHDRLYKILKELCHEESIIDSLTVFDKDAIAIQLRYHFISTKYEEKEMDGGIEAIKNTRLSFKPYIEEVDGINMQLEIPSIQKEKKILSQYSKGKNISINTQKEEDIRELVADAYILEVIKFVSKVQIVGTDIVVDFSLHNVEENIKVVETLGRKVCDSILEFINKQREEHKDMYFLDDNTEIEINSSLFG